MGELFRLPKRELRRLLLHERRRREPGAIAALSRAVCAWVVRLVAFRQAAHVVAYAAQPDEIDPTPVILAGLADGKMIYFPRVVGPGLDFLASTPAALRAGSHGVLEPDHGLPLAHAPSDVLFLVPGVAFDLTGVRLGRGGGHYDRALSRYGSGCRVGLALEAQVAKTLPSDPWDEPVDIVITEQRLLWTAGRPGASCKENSS